MGALVHQKAGYYIQKMEEMLMSQSHGRILDTRGNISVVLTTGSD